MFLPWTLLVISFIKTGANLCDRSFLCTQRKLTSAILIYLPSTMIYRGMAEIKAMIF